MGFKTLHYDLSVLQINENTCKIKFNKNLLKYSIEMHTVLGIKEYTYVRGHPSSHFQNQTFKKTLELSTYTASRMHLKSLKDSASYTYK